MNALVTKFGTMLFYVLSRNSCPSCMYPAITGPKHNSSILELINVARRLNIVFK
jgi:hypothetical protein